jgi:hypothetical protein
VATKIAADDWEELVVCFKNRIGQPLKTKSAWKRFYDGAAIATFKITFKDETYKSPSFDHGFLQKYWTIRK